MTLEEYNSASDRQSGLCLICNKKEEGKRLNVDHSHKTGKVRGLLCGPCNRGLGDFKDNTEAMLKAIEYLKINE